MASLLDGVRASGNRDIHVKMSTTERGYRLGAFTVPVDEEVESVHLKFIAQPPGEPRKMKRNINTLSHSLGNDNARKMFLFSSGTHIC